MIHRISIYRNYENPPDIPNYVENAGRNRDNLDVAIDDDNLYCRPEEHLDRVLNPLLCQPIVWPEYNFEDIHVRAFIRTGQLTCLLILTQLQPNLQITGSCS